MAATKARWAISLDCNCPKCNHDIDIVDIDNELFNNGVSPIEHDTAGSIGYEVSCPKCGHDFCVDFEW